MHLIPKSDKKYFKFKYATIHDRKEKTHKVKPSQEAPLHIHKIHHVHVYEDKRTGKLLKEEYYPRRKKHTRALLRLKAGLFAGL